MEKSDIKIERTLAKPRVLKSTWSNSALNDFNDSFGELPKPSPLEELVEALDDETYDPTDPDSMEDWRRRRSESESLKRLTQEILDKIDREILTSLSTSDIVTRNKALNGNTGVKLGMAIRGAIEAAKRGEHPPHDWYLTIKDYMHEIDLEVRP